LNNHDKVTIIGGGIGGLTLANALQKTGIEFDLYEQAPELTEVGAGIGLTAAVIKLLDLLDLGNDVREQGAGVGQACLVNKLLEPRRIFPVSDVAWCIHRALLIDILKSRLPKEHIHLSKKAVDIKSDPDSAEIIFSDNTSVKSSCVVAADGIGSAIRSKLIPEIKIRPINQTIWRGISKMEVPEMMRNSFIEIWDEELRFLTVPYNDQETFWLAVKSSPPGLKDNIDTVHEDLINLFGNYHPVVKDLIRNTRGEILRNDMADLGLHKHPWHHNRVVFLGDAIHATTPNLGQGGCQAIESAVCLALCLKSDASTIEEKFNTYRRLRLKKVNSIINTSWKLGVAAHSSNPIVHHFYRFILEHSPAPFIRYQERKLNDIAYLKKLDRNMDLFRE